MKEKFIAKNYGGNYIQYLLYEAFLLIQRVLTKYRWRCKNRHNQTSIKNIVDINRISVGNYTSGDLDVRLSNVENSFVKIGSFCCIAAECEFLCLSNHPTDWLLHERVERYYIPGFKSRFVNPMKIKCNIGIKDEKLIHEKTIEKNKKTCHGPIIIDNDVWLGTGVKIMSGVHIGQGAAIGAGAVVTKDIPPYAIAVGIPARVIKYRFPENKIKKLLQIDFNNLSLEKLREIYPETIKEDFDIDYILEKLKE